MFEREFLRGGCTILQEILGASASLVDVEVKAHAGIFLDFEVATAECRVKERYACFAHVERRYHLTRHKISDRARQRAWLQAGRTNYTKITHRSGARFAASPG